MRTFSFKAKNIGREKYLTYIMGEDCELDEDALDYCEENHLKELIGIIYEEDDDYDYLTYDITERISLEDYMSNGVNCEQVLFILRNVAQGLISLKEQAIHLAYILLNKNFMYVDTENYDISFICLPVESKGSVVTEFKGFVRQMLANLQYDVDEDLNYVGKLLTYINGDSFNLRGLVGLTEALMEEAGIDFEEAGAIETDGVEVVNTNPVDEEAGEEKEESHVMDFMEDLEDGDTALPEIGDDEEEETEEESVAGEDELESILPAGMTAAKESESEKVEKGEVSQETDEKPEQTEEEQIIEDQTAEEQIVEEQTAEEQTIEEQTEEEQTIEEQTEENQTEEEQTIEEQTIEEQTVEKQIPEQTEKIPEKEEVTKEVSPNQEMEEITMEDAPVKAPKTEEIEEIPEIKVEMPETKTEEAPEAKTEKKTKKKEAPVDRIEMPSDQEIEPAETAPKKNISKEADINLIKNRIKELVGEVPDAKTQPSDSGAIKTIEDLDEILDNTRPPAPKKNVIKVNRAAIIQSVAAEQKNENASKDNAAGNTHDEANSDKKKPKSNSVLSKTVEDASQNVNTLLNAPKAVPYLIRVNTDERIMLNKPVFKIGKATRGVDYTVSGNGAISRQHAVITQKDGVCYIKDNKSTNHTFVNGKKIEDGDEEILTHDSVIRLGDEEFLFKIR